LRPGLNVAFIAVWLGRAIHEQCLRNEEGGPVGGRFGRILRDGELPFAEEDEPE